MRLLISFREIAKYEIAVVVSSAGMAEIISGIQSKLHKIYEQNKISTLHAFVGYFRAGTT